MSAVLPAEKNDGISLWHVKYVDDDDSEDVEEGSLLGLFYLLYVTIQQQMSWKARFVNTANSTPGRSVARAQGL